ncbi:hypothetical protein [Microbulbifer aggregans]|uniref:hypothetical protein n=1 Tax=Microbulbifer aggregans TaxID=1769779 RepID=UPI001CFD7371|nr:hypothetical protein [Microbulbifer aggregans]
MNTEDYLSKLVAIFPGFEESWKNEDIYREDDGSFTEHSLMACLTDFYRNHFKLYTKSQCIAFSQLMEGIVAPDPDDSDLLANAICTCFLENIAGDKEGEFLRPFLGKLSEVLPMLGINCTNKVLQPTSYFAHSLRGRCAPIFAQKVRKVSRR